MSKRILIIHATGGMGHVTAAKAIEEAFGRFYPDVEVRNIDVIEYANKVYQQVFVKGYNFVSAKTPHFWSWLYHFFNRTSQQKIPQLLSQLSIESKLIPYIQEYGPDFIISTHPLPMKIVSHSKQKALINILSAIVVTDFGCHTYWIDNEVNYYFVAHEVVSECLEHQGVNPSKTKAMGIPIRLNFSRPIDRLKVFQDLKFDPAKPTLLVVGGQLTYEELNQLVTGVQAIEANTQFILVCGRDQELYNRLEQARKLSQQPNIRIFSFIKNIEEYMAAASLIFTKAGGLTVSECLAMSLPMVVYKVIPGQEEDNIRFLLAEGAAWQGSTLPEIVSGIGRLLAAPQELEKMKKACHQLGRPHSAQAIADFVMQRIKR